MTDNEMVEIDFDYVKKHLDKSYIVVIDKKEVILPKSQVEDFDEERGQLSIPQWLALNEGLI